MNSPSPIFSIIIPTYNRGHLIGKTIESVIGQEFKDFEILVVDDGSTDNTEQVVLAFGDRRIQYLRKQNGERGAARNYGAARAKGKYINFFDSDDLMYPNHLLVATEVIASANNPEFFHLAYDHQRQDGVVTRKVNNFHDKIQYEILFDNKLSCNGVFLRSDIALKYRFEEDRVLASSEDWELWIRLICCFKLFYSNNITSSVVNHDQRSLFTIPAQKVIERDLLLIEKLKYNDSVLKTYGKAFQKYIAQRYTFFMLCLSEEKKKIEVWRWGIRAVFTYPLIITSKRFLASIKNSILR